jgi:hypothetical protein
MVLKNDRNHVLWMFFERRYLIFVSIIIFVLTGYFPLKAIALVLFKLKISKRIYFAWAISSAHGPIVTHKSIES